MPENTKVELSQINGYMQKSIIEYGADRLGINDSTASIQSAIDSITATGGRLTFPSGTYKLSTAGDYCLSLYSSTVDGFPWSTPYCVDLVGDGGGNTVLKSVTTDKYALQVSGNPTTSGGTHLFSSIKNLSFGGTARSHGLKLLNAAFYKLEDSTFMSNDIGLKLENVLSTEISNCAFWGNYTGVSALRGSGGTTNPNAITFTRCQFASNSTVGYEQSSGTNNTFIGSNFEGNGTQGNASTGAVNINVDGTDGDVGANFQGCYFEGNGGAWDVNIVNTGSRYITHTFTGCNFNRYSSAKYVTNNVRSIGKNILVFNGCTFTSYGSYVENIARIYINGDANTIIICNGCTFGSSVASHNLDLGHGNCIISNDSGYIATGCATPFAATDSSKIQYFNVKPTVGGLVTIGKPYTVGTPGFGFRSSASTPDGSWDSQFYATGGGGGIAGDLVAAAENLKTKNIIPLVDNAYTLGKSTCAMSAIWSRNGTIQTCDERLKTDFKECDLGLNFISLLEPKSWRWIIGGTEFVRQVYRDANGNECKQTDEGAVIAEIETRHVPGKRRFYSPTAQNVKAALDKLGVDDFAGWVLSDVSDPDSTQALRLDQFVAPLIKSVQELLKRVESLEGKNGI